MLRVHRFPPFFVALFVALSSWAQSPLQTVGTNPGQISTRSQNLGVPLAFEPNQGQAVEGVDFLARGQGYSAQLRADRLTLVLNGAHGDVSAENAVGDRLGGCESKRQSRSRRKIGRTKQLPVGIGSGELDHKRGALCQSSLRQCVSRH
jgi:hypothetical protein